ncbi:hypothetical protein HDU91_005124 [Kappamyces sp. JEL0680]|nr:hypothetical protein HDU91_005124 [Kappamyces sp. JEL0680]
MADSEADFSADDEDDGQLTEMPQSEASPPAAAGGKKKKGDKKGGKKKGKGKKKKKMKKIKLPKDMVMNERGEIVTAKETEANEILQENVVEQEKDALQVIAALHKENEKKDVKIRDLQADTRRLEEAIVEAQEKIRAECALKMDNINAILAEKEAAYKIMQQEFAVIKDFRRKRQELLQELEDSKAELVDTEKRHRAIITRMEKKFFEEKIRLQKEANAKIGELASKAHKEAVTNLNDTTKDVYKENIRMSEALLYHVEEGAELNKLNNELLLRNRDLSEENELHGAIVKEKIVQSKKQELEIRALKEKIHTMEFSLTHIVQEFEAERKNIGALAKTELEEVKKVVQDLTTKLVTKTTEMRYIKRLAQHILDQRTEMEEFFMDSLEHVKTEIKNTKLRDLKATQEKYKQNMRELLKHKTTIPPLKPLKPSKRDDVLDLVKPSSAEDTGASEKVDIKDLSWTDKENILRILFSKMNGVSLAHEAEQRASRSSEELLRSSRHRSTGFAELEPLALDSAASGPSQRLTSSDLAAEKPDERWLSPSQVAV